MRLFFRYIFPCILVIFVLSFSGQPYGNEFKDSLGRKVVLEKDPCRIVSLAPNLTEILYYLGLGDRVAGVTDYSYYPPEALDKPRVGSYINSNIERIISLSPDLVIGTKDGNRPGVVYLLEHAGIPVYVVNPRNLRDIISTISEIGTLCGVSEKARLLVNRLNKRLEAVQKAAASVDRRLVFLQINLSPIMTVNKNTYHNDLIYLAGGKNMSADEPITYPRISIEEVIRREPDVIIISSMDRRGEFEKAKEDWMKWSSIPAVKPGLSYRFGSY